MCRVHSRVSRASGRAARGSAEAAWRSRRGRIRARVRRRRRQDPPKTRAQRRAEARAKAKELMRREGEQRKAGGQPGHRGAGRELRPEDQVDEIVDHYPEACGGCGRRFDDGQRRPGGRFGRHQVCELPPISVLVSEHRTHQLRCRHCRARTSARLPREIGGSAFGPQVAGGGGDVDRPASDLAPGDQRARPRSVRRPALDRRGRRDLPARLRRARRPAPARCRTGCSNRARCMSMRPAGGPAVRGARCGPRPPRARCSYRSPSTATARSSTRSSARMAGSWSLTAGTAIAISIPTGGKCAGRIMPPAGLSGACWLCAANRGLGRC